MRWIRSDKGLTLIELVVAMAVFALVAIMGLQSLTGSLSMRDRLSEKARATDRLSQSVALLRNDLASALPMFFFPPKEGRPASAIRAEKGGKGFQLSVGGQPGLSKSTGGQDATDKQRVIWRFDEGARRLTRQAWPTLYPVEASQIGPEMTAFEGVSGMTLRSFWTGEGWVPGLSAPANAQATQSVSSGGDEDSAGTSPETYSTALPHAIEITLTTTDYGQIVLLEYFQ